MIPLYDLQLKKMMTFYLLGISFDEFQLEDDSSIDLQHFENEQFAIFVSFAEIYNEFIYDLLVEVPAGQRRMALKVAQDKHQNYFIKGTGSAHTNTTLQQLLSVLTTTLLCDEQLYIGIAHGKRMLEPFICDSLQVIMGMHPLCLIFHWLPL